MGLLLDAPTAVIVPRHELTQARALPCPEPRQFRPQVQPMPEAEERASGIVDRLGLSQAELHLTVEGQPRWWRLRAGWPTPAGRWPRWVRRPA
jgi:hypothetical protein